MKVGLVSLGEAGNYGDDLILLAVLDAMADSEVDVDMAFLSFDCPMDLEGLRGVVRMPRTVERRQYDFRSLLPRRHQLFSDRDLVLVGGGGLLQTSHHPERPYHWLGFLPEKKHGVPVVGVGLGLGPLSDSWQRELTRMGSPFSSLHVRDDDSAALVGSWGWPAERCHDFIEGDFLQRFLDSVLSQQGTSTEAADSRTGRRLGVSLRQWPGASTDFLARHVERIAKAEDCDQVTFFVLESKHGRGVDVEFTRSVAAAVSSATCDVCVYDSTNLVSFTAALAGVDAAVSMKLHSSAVWGAVNVPMYPIVYAPKMAAFFGLPYKGLEFMASREEPAEPPSVPSAHAVVAASVCSQAAGQLGRPQWQPNLGWAGAHHGKSVVHDAVQKARRRLRSGR